VSRNRVVLKPVDDHHHGVLSDDWRVEPTFTSDLPRRSAHPLVGRFGVRHDSEIHVVSVDR
jgi:hypothetical protein